MLPTSEQSGIAGVRRQRYRKVGLIMRIQAVSSNRAAAVSADLVRRRIAKSLRKGNTVQSAVRTELSQAGAGDRDLAIDLVLAALLMPDSAGRQSRLFPSRIDRTLGAIEVNSVLFVVRPRGTRIRTVVRCDAARRRKQIWSLDIVPNRRRHPVQGAVTAVGVADFVGQSVMLRARGLRSGLAQWVALIGVD